MHRKITLIGILIITILSSCQKIPFDYRNQFIGDWEFMITMHSIQYHGDSATDHYDTSYYADYIDYGKNQDEVIIKYYPENELNIGIEDDDDFTGYFSGGSISGVGFDKLYLSYRVGGQGWPGYVEVHGSR